MKQDDVLSVLRCASEKIDCSPDEARLYEMAIEQVIEYCRVVEYYALKNYDKGLVARRVLGRMSEDDKKILPIVHENSVNLELGRRIGS